MNIALIGYGKMGKVIENIALKRNHNISFALNVLNANELHLINTQNTDVAIEFTQPEQAVKNITYCFQNNIPVVCGTTGWLKDWDKVVKMCQEMNATLFYASNYSLGVNIFFKLNEYLASLMNMYENYDARIVEIHHTEKKDAPSGTAITLAEGLLKMLHRKEKWEKGISNQKNVIGIESIREPDVPGTHQIFYESLEDTIEIKHTAHSRKGFALGAVLAAEFVKGKKGIYTMNDLLSF
jgi:4-hydroxy-tetrahydrodipicolinate reductase